MKFLFEDQPHQLTAVNAIVDLFDSALMPPRNLLGGAWSAPGAAGHRAFRLDLETLLANTRLIQTREQVPESTELKFLSERDLLGTPTAFPNFSIEMETGTGKTYVYIRTCLRLAQEYGLRKFVIAVHSAAIRAGVLKTFEQTTEHFASVFDGMSYGWGGMSDNSGLDDFLDPSDAVRFLVVMVQSFDKPEKNLLYRTPETIPIWGGSAPRIESLSATQPVVIIDEPQNMESDKRRQAIATLSPLFALRYSATHKNPYNLVHRLDARTAQAKGLVKSIIVKGVAPGRDAGQAFVALLSTSAKGKSDVRATLRVNTPDNETGGVKQTELTVTEGSDLEEETGLNAYAGWIVEEIERDPERITFENGEILDIYVETETDRKSIWRDQLYQTIRAHLSRQAELDKQGVDVKVLSLIFVDHVEDYEGDEAVLPALFDETYTAVCAKFFTAEEHPKPDTVRTAYFARNAKGTAKDVGPGFSSRKAIENKAYDLIIANKEKILIRAEPAAFIFSHSALREGWDNPNVFQACFLRHVRSPIERRQQIGRGLRLAVKESGERLMSRDLNKLTLIVDETFSEFRDALNKEYAAGKGKKDVSESNVPDIENLDSAVEVWLRPAQRDSAAFENLWKRIRYRTRYRVDLSSDALVEAVLAGNSIKELRRIRVTANRVSSGRLRFDEDGRVTTSDGEVSGAQGTQMLRVGSLPDPVRLVEDRLQAAAVPLNLTRTTIRQIIARAPHKDRAIRQPEQWCAVLARAIQDAAIESMVKGIIYELLPEADWWTADLVFTEPVVAYDKPEPDPGAPWRGVVETRADGPNLNTHVIHDSRVERRFGLKLDEDDDVQLFCKLPRRFSIDTPVGRYSPDFAVVVLREGVEQLYLIRETKATLSLKDLDWDEELRIRFAFRHFDAAPESAVHYDHTTDAAGLRLPP